MPCPFAAAQSLCRPLVDALKARAFADTAPLRVSVRGPLDRVPFAEALRGDFAPAEPGSVYGPLFATFWFRLEGEIPAAWAGSEVHLHFHNRGEGLVFSAEGEPLQGLTSADWAPEEIRTRFRLADSARGGEPVRLYVESACNPLAGAGIHPWNRVHDYPLTHARLVRLDPAVDALALRLQLLLELIAELPSEEPLRGRAAALARDLAARLRPEDASTHQPARAALDAFFAAHRSVAPASFRLAVVGHAHIDTAWLWPYAEARRKCARTFSSALGLMERHPRFTFACAQAVQLSWIKEDHPGLYARLLARAREGRFVPVGGSWTEFDCNLPSGESFVRQFLLGQRFFRAEFGHLARVFWNPDVFGYSAALPQILRGVGMEGFLTQKLSWSDTNRLPAHTLDWEGHDGSRVRVHFPPADNYACHVRPSELLRARRGFLDHDRATEALFLYGHGDGGGGPTEGMLERLALLDGLGPLPPLRHEHPEAFFDRIRAETPRPRVWSGELYLETHRGTYTSQARAKHGNRRCEALLREVELLWSLVHARRLAAYPATALARVWEQVLLHQFHDVLPGSSISEVHREVEASYLRLEAELVALRADALARLASPPADTATAPRLHVVNLSSAPRVEPVAWRGGHALVEAPALSAAVLTPRTSTAHPVGAAVADGPAWVLENHLVRARFDSAGRLLSFFDKRARREAVSAGRPAHQFALHIDKPRDFDAWNLDAEHLDLRSPCGDASAPPEIASAGPLVAELVFHLRVSPVSIARVRARLSAESPRLEFETWVDWREDQRVLKVEFPLAIRADHATYEIQHGQLRRPTHLNTSWEEARFEVPAQRWADLSDSAWGLALLNTDKHGHSCRGSVLTLTLLRAPRWPDPDCDRGEHSIRYALFPHAGGPAHGGVTAEAIAFNHPLLAAPASAAPAVASYFECDHAALIVDAVKKAEDGDALVVRLYDSAGGAGRARLRCRLPHARVEQVNLLEEEPSALATDSEGWVEFSYRAFELITLRFE